MIIKTLFNTKPSSKTDLLIILVDNTLRLKESSLSLDTKYEGKISKTLKSDLFESKKGSYLIFTNPF